MAKNLSRLRAWTKSWRRGKTPYKRTEITVETDQLVIIQRRRSMRARCQQCGCEVDMVDLGEAEALTGMTGPTLRIYAEARGWHVSQVECSDFICLESWLKSMAGRDVHGQKP